MCVCLSTGEGGVHVTITHDALDLTDPTRSWTSDMGPPASDIVWPSLPYTPSFPSTWSPNHKRLISGQHASYLNSFSGWPRHREDGEFGSYFFQTGKHREFAVTRAGWPLHRENWQGVKVQFFPIFLSILLFFLFFCNFLLFFLFFSHFTYNKQIFVRDLNILSLFKYVVYRVH